MTHSDAAMARHPHSDFYGLEEERKSLRVEFDAGRASVLAERHTTDRETLRTLIREFAADNSMEARDLADAILAAPSLSLVAVRDEVAPLTLAELREADAGPREGCTDACCAARVRSGKDEA